MPDLKGTSTTSTLPARSTSSAAATGSAGRRRRRAASTTEFAAESFPVRFRQPIPPCKSLQPGFVRRTKQQSSLGSPCSLHRCRTRGVRCSSLCPMRSMLLIDGIGSRSLCPEHVQFFIPGLCNGYNRLGRKFVCGCRMPFCTLIESRSVRGNNNCQCESFLLCAWRIETEFHSESLPPA